MVNDQPDLLSEVTLLPPKQARELTLPSGILCFLAERETIDSEGGPIDCLQMGCARDEDIVDNGMTSVYVTILWKSPIWFDEYRLSLVFLTILRRQMLLWATHIRAARLLYLVSQRQSDWPHKR